MQLTLEKLISARAKVFVGSRFSTFTDDVFQIRHALKTISCGDTFLCHGEKEWDNDFTGLSPYEIQMKLDWITRTKAHNERMRRKAEAEARKASAS